MTQAELTQYRSFWRKRNQKKLSSLMEAEMREARREAKRLSQFLVEEFGVTAVYLFGSFAWGPDISADSDLDLAVTGLPSGQLITASRRIAEETPCLVDLVPLEKLPEILQKRILHSGIQLQ